MRLVRYCGLSAPPSRTGGVDDCGLDNEALSPLDATGHMAAAGIPGFVRWVRACRRGSAAAGVPACSRLALPCAVAAPQPLCLAKLSRGDAAACAAGMRRRCTGR